MRKQKCDIAIIGAGTAGLSAYNAAKKSGLSVILIEGGPHGTTCARVGCMPSKLLIAAAEAAHRAQNSGSFGVHIDGAVRIDGREVMARVRRERDRFVSFVLDDVRAMPQTDKLQGTARFISDGILGVGDDIEVHAGRVIIATGTSPIVPELYQALGDRLVVNDDVFEWQDLPGRVLVVGSGVMGVELGQALARLGTQVQIINRSEGFAHITDPVVHKQACQALQKEVDIRQNVDVLTVQREGDEAVVTYSISGGPVQTGRYDYVLLTVGRHHNLDSLALAKTSMPLDERGVPKFDPATMQVSDLPVFIAGDVNGRAAILHEAADDGWIAGTNAGRYPDVQPYPRRAPMAIVFSDPQIARVGQSFKALEGSSIMIGQVDFANQGRARVMNRNQGMLRIYARTEDARFMGAEMVGPDIEHIAHLLAWCHQQGLSIPQMVAMPFYHPTLEEGLRTALHDTLARALP
ncbi:dihydrolipoyl dehydrogenase [Alcaligenaceae bacterium CGII-47]|nr:dihydrolipoyl dehydrogenase [Alcaligenaceae bacterium CGII-47]